MKLDPRLTDAVADLQRRVLRRMHGRVTLTVELEDGDVVSHHCREDGMTFEDVRRLLSAMPDRRDDG